MTGKWILVSDRLPDTEDDMLVTDGEAYAVGYWREDAQAWDSCDFGWLENREEPPCGIHTVIAWRPLPALPGEEEPDEDTGTWVKEDTFFCLTPGGNGIYHCSKCGYQDGPDWIPKLSKYCPNCGRRMLNG